MIIKNKKYIFVLIIFCICSFGQVNAQGDGPRAFMLAPKGVAGINAKWMNLNQNFLPGSNILVESANLDINVFPVTLFYNFGIADHYAQALFMFNPGKATGSITSNLNIPYDNQSVTGFSDGFLGLKFGLIGSPALDLLQFAKHKPDFSLMSYFKLWYSGSYDSSNALNLGSNRLTYEMGLPIVIPVFKSSKNPLWIEAYPFIQFYSTNTEPSFISRSEESYQKPLFGLETHYTYNLSDKFWTGIDLRYQYGGEVELDGVTQDNKINILGGGLSAGYQILPFLSISGSYGKILTGDNNAKSDLIRLSLIFVYANTKNLNMLNN
ncbi:MAG TPA: transporter [Ignavibacteria bacterium]|nr:transporter [Ignavibacteria bacterium]HMR39239.1 transporter [Ignavibacteria bacterium]